MNPTGPVHAYVTTRTNPSRDFVELRERLIKDNARTLQGHYRYKLYRLQTLTPMIKAGFLLYSHWLIPKLWTMQNNLDETWWHYITQSDKNQIKGAVKTKYNFVSLKRLLCPSNNKY